MTAGKSQLSVICISRYLFCYYNQLELGQLVRAIATGSFQLGIHLTFFSPPNEIRYSSRRIECCGNSKFCGDYGPRYFIEQFVF